MNTYHMVNHFISAGWVLKIYTPIPGKWIFRALLELETEYGYGPIMGEIANSLDDTLESLNTAAKQKFAEMEAAGVA